MKAYANVVGTLLLMVVVVVGCGREDAVEVQEARTSAAQTSEVARLQEWITGVEQEEGAMRALLQGIGALLALEDAHSRQEWFGWLLERAAVAEDTETVVKFVYALVEHDPPLAAEAIRMLDATMMERDPLRWMGYLQADVLPPQFRMHGYALWFRHYGREAPVAEILRMLITLEDHALQEHSEWLFLDVLRTILQDDPPEQIWALLGILRIRIEPESWLRPGVLDIVGQALLRDARLEDAIAHYRMHADALGDRRIAGVMMPLLQKANAGERADLVAEIRGWGYGLEDFSMSRNHVARWDMEQLGAETDVLDIVQRLREILAHGIPVQVFSSRFTGNLLYPVLARASEGELQALRDLVLEMEAAAAEAAESVRMGLATALLDIYFYLEDYRGVLTRIEQGVPGYDAEWHAELHNKVQAHLAQAEGRTADAVAFYSAHIERVRGWEAPLASPEDGRLIVPDEVIALNERRIGDIWKAEGESIKAGAAYARAREHYEAALQQYRDDPLRLAVIEQKLAELNASVP